jgi:hypothetical protein
VYGIRDGIPSGAAAITYKDNGQEELSGFPFWSGVAPNWTAWSTGDQRAAGFDYKANTRKPLWRREPDRIKVADDGKVLVVRDPRTAIKTGADKPLIQIIKTTSPDAIAGVYRKFLGLTPGHTYRLSARLYALDMPKAEGDWSFSLHAVPTSQAKSDLTVQQMAGLAALPDGSSGPDAGLIVLYGLGVWPDATQQITTRPKCRTASAPAEGPVADLVTGDIKLPEGADTITVWVRHEAAHSTGVGLDWVRLEDVTK